MALPFCFEMTLPNRLTVARLLLAAFFVIARESTMTLAPLVAAAAFALAVATDYLDGVLARRMKCETNFGRLMDPLADKILVAAALVSLAWSHDIPAWAAIILISRDFLITGLRQLALSDGVVLAADPAGKTKTASQMILIGFFLVRDAVGPFVGLPPWPAAVIHTGQVLIGASVLLSVYSGWRYTRAHWNMVIQSGRS
jgi:CDP-diacylglycerol--glycerol-3-phosphate 3-phosphatidyltransferase